MKNLLRNLFAAAAIAVAPGMSAGVDIVNATVEGMSEPLGLDTDVPRFSWQLVSDRSDVLQSGWRVIVSSTPEKAERLEGDLWDSGLRDGRRQTWIEYEGKPIPDNGRAYWRVMARTNKGNAPWSRVREFGMGLRGEGHWSGRWIGLETQTPDEVRGRHTVLPARYLRKEFRLKDKPVKRATAHITGLGLYRLFIGGEEVAPAERLKPVPSDYRRTVYANSFDVTALMDSVTPVGIMLGNGRYFPMQQHKAGKIPVFGRPAVRLNIIVEYADGSRQKFATDDSWRITVSGPIRSNNEYDGEIYDARMELGDWTEAGYDDSGWRPVDRAAIPYGTPRGQMTPNMTGILVGHPRIAARFGGKADTLLLDFGENMAGHIRISPRGAAGDTVKVRYAERLDSVGRIYTANLRDARSEDIYVCNGREASVPGFFWEPSFVYHGFRYAEVSGMPEATANDFEAVSVADPMAEPQTPFVCADSTLTAVVANARRGIRANYKGMPVDCPQRNERQPWLGDRTVGALGESYLFDNSRLYAKWIKDICDAQREDGSIPDVAPAFWYYYTDNITWPSALLFVSDMLMKRYADERPMREAYPHMKRWMNHMLKEYSKDGIITRDRYGDWCMPPESPELIHSEDPARQTDGALISTAYTVACLDMLGRFASMQGLEADSLRWHTLRDSTKSAFNRRFLTLRRGTSPVPGHPLYPDSVFYGNNTVTANLLPLAFGIVPDSLRSTVADNVIATIINGNGGHIASGVIGTSWLMRTLADTGYGDVAFLLASNRTYPSWGYMLDKGATTIWELWNGDTAAPWMNSGNHVMLLGDLLTWCYEDMAGIRPGDGYGRFVLAPDFSVPDCETLSASTHTPFGPVSSSWAKGPQGVEWDVELPPNTTADVCLPDGTRRTIGSGRHHLSSKLPTAHPDILSEEFLYTRTSFPQCHASTIVETENGDLVAAYFGGTHERHPDVCIWVSRKPKGSDTWSEPILAADGVFRPGTPDALLAGVNDSTTAASVGPILSYHDAPADSLRRKACWNPVLFEMPGGELWLFYKVGLKVADWTGWLVKSRDGGKTWSRREPLPQGFIGPVKNKPEIVDGRLICPSSTEGRGWKLHFEILDLATGQWKYVGPIEAETAPRTDEMLADSTFTGKRLRPIDCIQPSLLHYSDGRLQVLMRTRNGRLATSWSHDGGDTWSKVELTAVPNNQSGTDAVTLSDGRHLLIYNNFSTLPATKKGPRTPLSIAVSENGLDWTHLVTLEDSPISQYSYPAIIQGRDGSIHCVYTWRRQRVAYRKLKL